MIALKVPNLIKIVISRPGRVVISNKSLISQIVRGRIEADTNTAVFMKVVVEVTMLKIVKTNKSKTHGN